VYHPDFDAQFRDFADAVLAHAAHEEELEFPRIRWEFTDEQLHLMASEVLTVQSMA
jgi:hemerythrin superfamily protein